MRAAGPEELNNSDCHCEGDAREDSEIVLLPELLKECTKVETLFVIVPSNLREARVSRGWPRWWCKVGVANSATTFTLLSTNLAPVRNAVDGRELSCVERASSIAESGEPE